ncbi:MAG: AbrB/MazE/SpoVT family DNA-binding domain-containing protein [Acidobacteriota bacterium]
MPGATLTSKGQITIPKAVRDLLGLQTGDQVDFLLEDGSRVVLRAANRDARGLKGLLRRPGRGPVSIRQMDQAIRRLQKKS